MTERYGRQGRPQGRVRAGVRKTSTTSNERKQAMNDERTDGDGGDHEGSGPEPESGSKNEPRKTARQAQEEAETAAWNRMFGDEDHELWSMLINHSIRPKRTRLKIDEPWYARPGSMHDPTEAMVASDQERCRRYWEPFARMHHAAKLQAALTGAAPREQEMAETQFASPPFKRPLRFRAIFHERVLDAMRVPRRTTEQGGMCRKTALSGHRLITARSITGGQQILEFWLAPCFRSGFEDHVEIMAAFLVGTGYREPITIDASEFHCAHFCLAHLRFAVEGPTDGRPPRFSGDPAMDWMARQPGFEAMFFGGVFPEIWWIADPGDDPFAIEIPEVGQ